MEAIKGPVSEEIHGLVCELTYINSLLRTAQRACLYESHSADEEQAEFASSLVDALEESITRLDDAHERLDKAQIQISHEVRGEC